MHASGRGSLTRAARATVLTKVPMLPLESSRQEVEIDTEIVQNTMNFPADKSKQLYDVLVVGSGASGGWAAKRLAEAGLKVAMLKPGRPQSSENFSEHTPEIRTEVPRHGSGSHAQDSPDSIQDLCCQRVQLRVVLQRHRRTLYYACSQTLRLAGPNAHGRRSHERLGPRKPSLQ